MSANRKVILIVILGVGAGLIVFILSQYFAMKMNANRILLTQVQQLPQKVEDILRLSKNFIQDGDQEDWRRIIINLTAIHLGDKTPDDVNGPWQKEINDLNILAGEYRLLLNLIHGPAVELNQEKLKLQGSGLAFSAEVERRILKPYRKEEALRLYQGDPIDPFKSRVKETAYDLMRLHLNQQLILLELLLDWDLPGYQRKKQTIASALEKQKAQLQYLNVLMGSEPSIKNTIDSLERRLVLLAQQEKTIIGYFIALNNLNRQLTNVGDRLRDASDTLAARIISDTKSADQLNRTLSWSLLVAILAGLSLLGTMLAVDIIHFVEDLKANRTKIKESETNLEVTLNSIGDAVIATDERGVISRMNPAAERLTGWLRTDAVGRDLPVVFNIVNAHTREKVANPAEKVLARGEIIGLANHTLLIARDGSEYQIADSGAPIRSTDGDIIGVVLVFRDVTDVYAQEQKIRASERQLKDITANVPGVVYQFKATPTHIYSSEFISEKAFDIFGLPAEPQTFFTQFHARIPDDERHAFMSSIREAVEKRSPWRYEGRFTRPDGKTIWFSANAIPHRNGDAIIFYGVLMDITRRRQMEESLRLTQFCFDKASIGIFRIGEEAQILNVNDQACHSLGYTREALCRMTVFDIDPRFSPDIWPDHIANLRKDKTRTIETQHRHKSGKLIPVQILINLMIFEDHEFHIAFVQDITARKLAEDETKRLEAALVQAQKMEALGTLAGGIAHDFNNILSAVVGYAQLSLGESDPYSSLHHNLEQIFAAGMRASDLVRQILTFSRQAKHEQKPLQVAPLIKEALKLLRSSLPATIEIHQEFADRTDDVMANATQIHQIIMNLCTNAAQAMEETGGQMTVGLEQIQVTERDRQQLPGLEPGDHIMISVKDTGLGIPPENLEMIFDPYFTTKESDKGTGLGLSVVHGIVKSYGGNIYADSHPKHGTLFRVYLPAIAKQSISASHASHHLPTGSETILLVDDEPLLLEVGQKMLQRLGYSVQTCLNSRDALSLFKQSSQTIDLVISDVTMPKMTGDILAAAMLEIRPDLPVILCTGFSSRLTEKEAAGIGAKALVLKPLVMETLAVIVRDVLDGTSNPAGMVPLLDDQ